MSTDALLGNTRVAKMNIRQGKWETKKWYMTLRSLFHESALTFPLLRATSTDYRETPCSKMDTEGEMERNFTYLLTPSSIGHCLFVGSSSLDLTGQTMELPRRA